MSALGKTALIGTEKIPSYGNNRLVQLKPSKHFQTQANFFELTIWRIIMSNTTVPPSSIISVLLLQFCLS